ncbi:MAG TPA: high frequency lysogenization protein HflD [Rhodanobacteraceae bacterium]|nr:high frequency lysogenization protein HflD [Rhodanobacteraceae bacterium]
MNEPRTMALAGVFQAALLVRRAALGQTLDEDALRASIHSVFMLDADDVAHVYDGPAGLRVGLHTLIAQLDGNDRDLQVTRIAMTLLRLQQTLAARSDMLGTLHEGIADAQRQVDHFGLLHGTVMARLADLYVHTASTLRPRVMVTGDATVLQQPAQVERIRSLLLAGIRSAVLWRQLGGRRWRLLLHRQRQAMLARGMLSRIAMERGD